MTKCAEVESSGVWWKRIEEHEVWICWMMVGESTAELNEVAVEIDDNLAISTTVIWQ